MTSIDKVDLLAPEIQQELAKCIVGGVLGAAYGQLTPDTMLQVAASVIESAVFGMFEATQAADASPLFETAFEKVAIYTKECAERRQTMMERKAVDLRHMVAPSLPN